VGGGGRRGARLSSSLFARLLPPIDASVAGSDASTYLGLAQHLARTGRLSDHDALVAGMSPAEREALFRNRFADDRTGPYARFPGGMSLASPAGATVHFHFFRLFPVWLAVGLQTVGGALYLRLMSLFATVGLVSLFVVGRRVGGAALGLLACAVHASFYPQAFFSRFPTSEMLAQALFLSGLAALVCGNETEGGDRRHAHLAGWLVGAMCLCRVDALPFVALGLAAVSLLPARTGVRTRDWVGPAATTDFASTASCQLATSIHYVGALPHGRLWAAPGALVSARPWIGWVGVALVAATAALLGRAAVRGEGARALLVSRAGLLAFSAVFLGIYCARADARLASRSLRWIAMYTTPGVLLLLGAGVALAIALACGRGTGRLALSFFAGPAHCLGLDPMVVPLQPWAMRRFVPVVFPLLLLLALRGWQVGLRSVLGRAAATAVLAGVALSVAFTFLATTVPLAGRSGRPAAAAAVRALAEAIPEEALVVPDASGDLLHPPEYAHGRTCSLPLAEGASADAWDSARGYLSRQSTRGSGYACFSATNRSRGRPAGLRRASPRRRSRSKPSSSRPLPPAPRASLVLEPGWTCAARGSIGTPRTGRIREKTSGSSSRVSTPRGRTASGSRRRRSVDRPRLGWLPGWRGRR
jgi:hypothetical protein